MNEKLMVGDMRARLIHDWDKPFVRHRGFELDKDKKRVKKLLKTRAIHLHKAVHYIVDNDVLDVIIPSLRKFNPRHFRNAFWNAIPPHDSMFIEWDAKYLGSKVSNLPEASIKISGVWIEKKAEAGNAVHTYKLYYADENNTCSLGSYFGSTAYTQPENPISKYLEKHKYWRSEFLEQDYRFLTSPVCFESNEEETPLMSGVAGDYSRKVRETHASTGVLRRDISKDEELIMQHIHKAYDELVDRDYLELMLDQPCSWMDEVNERSKADPETQSLSRGTRYISNPYQRGYLAIATAIISLLNYDWVIEETENKTTKLKYSRTKRIGDTYKRVRITLPKSKAVTAFNKPPKRPRPFGNREHEVRGHFRFYKKTGERVWIDAHTRGDANIGVVHKDYELVGKKKENDDA